MKYPCVIETRLTYDHGGTARMHSDYPLGGVVHGNLRGGSPLTYDHGGTARMHCDYPLGLFNTIQREGQRAEIDRGQWPISLQLGFRPGRWAVITDVMGQPMTKIRVPEGVEPDFREYRFYSYGKLYILEFRFDSIAE